jgi:hypothetical protein
MLLLWLALYGYNKRRHRYTLCKRKAETKRRRDEETKRRRDEETKRRRDEETKRRRGEERRKELLLYVPSTAAAPRAYIPTGDSH